MAGLVPYSTVYESQLDLMEEIGWTQRQFDKLLELAAFWNASGRPKRILGGVIYKFERNNHNIFKWKRLFDWYGKMRIDGKLELTEAGEEILMTIIKPKGRCYAKTIQFGRVIAIRMRDDIIHKRLEGRITHSATGMPTYWISTAELEVEEETTVERPVHKSLVEDLCAAKPDRLLEILERHDCPFLKETIKLYRREKFVPYGIAENVKRYLHAVV